MRKISPCTCRTQTIHNANRRPPYSDRININVADRNELTRLYRIGDDIADEIIEYRGRHGPFKAAKQITNVPGIGRDWFENDAGDQVKV